MVDNEKTKSRHIKSKKYMLVRYGRMNEIGWFEHKEADIPKVHGKVVIKTRRGLELGCIVGQYGHYKGGQFRMDRQQLDEYFKRSEIDYEFEQPGKFVRYATAEDLSEERHLQKIAREEMKQCISFVEELALDMKIVDVEHIFGGERIIFYFTANGRIDFRQLVKKLAHEYQTRIEMRQIGARDEAKLLADVESCGQECCCKKFLRVLKPVNMRMAKLQKATLDPSKISGYCGRLKCCLRYEDNTYTELKERLPQKNSRVKTKFGEGKVVDTQILTQLVGVERSDGVKIAVPLEEIEVVSVPEKTTEQTDDDSDETRKNNTDNTD